MTLTQSTNPEIEVDFDPKLLKRVPCEELRFAVVLNGGVSLAVWMGGVAHELNRLTKGDDAYRFILDLARTSARADVIAGTSAGGINGAALALAQVNSRADLSIMRRLWEEQGRLESLLRQPFQGHPSSLLQGDDYFLPELNRAMHALADRPAVEENSIVDLTITATILNPASVKTVDDLGQSVYQQVHEGQFHFAGHSKTDESAKEFLETVRGGPIGKESPAARRSALNPFSMGNLPETASALAFAARCSAGFPVAFEPTFVPAFGNGSVPSGNNDSLRPDMGAWASWQSDGQEAPDNSRYAVDGGLLANTPTKAALAGIGRMSMQGPVRRIMLLVHPHAQASQYLPPDTPTEPPTLTKEVSGLLAALASQGNRSFVEQIEEHNRNATSGRGGRGDVLKSITSVADLYNLVDSEVWWNQYRALRIRRAARDRARDLARRSDFSPKWSYERKRRAILEAHENWFRARHSLPYVPNFISDAGSKQSISHLNPARSTNWGPAQNQYAADCPLRGWGWGITTALGIADSAADLIRLAQSSAHEHDPEIGTDQDPDRLNEAASDLAKAMAIVSNARACLDEAQSLTNDPWHEESWTSNGLEPDAEYWTLRLEAYMLAMLGLPDSPEDGLPAAKDCRESLLSKSGLTTAAGLGDTSAGKERGSANDNLTESRLNEKLLPLVGLVSVKKPTRIPRRWVGDAVAAQVWTVVTALAGVRRQVRALTSDGMKGAASKGRSALLTPIVDAIEANELAWSPQAQRDQDAEECAPSEQFRRCLLMRMLALEISTWLIADDRTADGTEQPITLVQLSAQVENHFTKGQLGADDKLAGQALSRFGGFLKRSWRMNDWTWGRLDAATLLCQIVLAPDRMRRIGEVAGYTDEGRAEAAAEGIVDKFVNDLYPGYSARGTAKTDNARLILPRDLDDLRADAVEELAQVFGSDERGNSRLPLALPNLANLAAYALQAKIIAEELPIFAAAIRADAAEGSNSRSLGEVFLAKYGSTVDLMAAADGNADGWVERGIKGLEAFANSGVGREPIREEVSSDQMIRTAATTAAVAVTMLDSEQSGLGPAKPVTRVLRGITLIPYWILTGLSKGSSTARYLTLFALAIGALLLVLSLFDSLPSWAASSGAALGVASLLAALGFAALRSGTILHGVAMLGLVVPAVVLATERALNASGTPPNSTPTGQSASSTAQSAAAGITTVVVTALVMAGLVVLGSIPNPMRTPAATVSDGIEAKTRRFLNREIGPAATDKLQTGRTYGFPWKYEATSVVRWLTRTMAWLLGLGVFTAIIYQIVAESARAASFVHAVEEWDPLVWVVLAGCSVLSVVGWSFARRNGYSLRVFQDSGPHAIPPETGTKAGNESKPTLKPLTARRLSYPAAVAATWSVVYGIFFGLVAVGTAQFLVTTDQGWALAILLNSVLFVIVLTVVIPIAAPRRYRARIVDVLASDKFLIDQVGKPDSTQATLLADLVRRGTAYAFLLKPSKAPTDLSAEGRDLYLRLRGETHRAKKGADLPRGRLPLSIHLLALSAGAALLLVGVPFAGWIAGLPNALFWGLALLVVILSVIEGLNLVVLATGLWRGALAASAVGIVVICTSAYTAASGYPELGDSEMAMAWILLFGLTGVSTLIAFVVAKTSTPEAEPTGRQGTEPRDSAN